MALYLQIVECTIVSFLTTLLRLHLVRLNLKSEEVA